MRHILIEKEDIDLKSCSFGFPWKHDSICFNFRMPEKCVTADSIEELVSKDDIETLVIGCDLSDYSFIEDMVNLKQLYIYSGTNIYSLDFIKKLNRLSQLYIADSHIETLNPVIELIKERKRLYDMEKDITKRLFMMIEGICINSDKNLDRKLLKKQNFYISEIIINKSRISG
ncbi:MAG: hypothetical protein IK990_02235 [Ruminiclostridium sp.]|nr:hypothetical protein [Ruminiclostridium sp.]